MAASLVPWGHVENGDLLIASLALVFGIGWLFALRAVGADLRPLPRAASEHRRGTVAFLVLEVAYLLVPAVALAYQIFRAARSELP